MAVDPTHLTSAYDSVDRSLYTTASITPTANRWLVIDVCNAITTGTAGTPVITGLSLTWVQEITQTNNAGTRRSTRTYAWTGASPGSGALDIDLGAAHIGCIWIVYELGPDVDTTDPFVQSVGDGPSGTHTSITLTLAAFGSANNHPLIAAHHNVNEANTAEAGYTEIADVAGASPTLSFASAFHPSATDTTPSMSWATASGPSAIASEIKAAAGGAADLVVQDASHSHSADSLGLVQTHNLTVQDAGHGHSTDPVAIAQVHNLAVGDASHGHTADNVVLATEGELGVQDASHAHSADNVVLTQVHQLAVQDAAHAHTADGLVVVPGLGNLDALHAHTADGLSLTQVHQLVVADATHAHTADHIALAGWNPVSRRSTTAVSRRELTAVSRRGA